MIYLITGQPGHGKTLYAIAWVRDTFPNRPVFFNGINLTDRGYAVLQWNELQDATQWHQLPPGAVVVIDEAQRVFRPMGNGAPVPDYISQLETHRHGGIDLVVITQHPMLVHTHVRRLLHQHQHVKRVFGTERAMVHRWDEVKDQCEKSRSGSVSKQFAYPREVYALYRSAELHTVKRSIPGRVWFMLIGVPLILLACVFMFTRWVAQADKPKPPNVFAGSSAGTAVVSPAGVTSPGGGGSRQVAQPLTERELIGSTERYLQDRVPRVHGLAHTAIAYDELTKPTQVPYPAGCVRSAAKGCKCFTDQATPLAVPSDLCEAIVAGGYFVDFRKESERGAREVGAARESGEKVHTASASSIKSLERPIGVIEGTTDREGVPVGGSWVGGRGKALAPSPMKR